MTIGIATLAVVAVLLFFGAAERFFDRAGLTSWLAFLLTLALIVGAVISTVTVLGYSAMAATIGGGGLGGIAIIWGHQRSHEDIIWVCVLLIVLIVQVIQELGMLLARKTDRRVRK